MEIIKDESEVMEIARQSVGFLDKVYNWDKYSDQQHGVANKEGDEPMSFLTKIHCRLYEVARRRAEASGRGFDEVFEEVYLEFHINEAKIMKEEMEVDPREAAMKDQVVVSEKENDVVCGVCQEEFEVGDQVARTACMHEFHGLCLWKWLHDHKTCPLCRFTLL